MGEITNENYASWVSQEVQQSVQHLSKKEAELAILECLWENSGGRVEDLSVYQEGGEYTWKVRIRDGFTFDGEKMIQSIRDITKQMGLVSDVEKKKGEGYGGADIQFIYLKMMQEGEEEGVQAIQKGKNFKEVLDLLANHRSKIATSLMHGEAGNMKTWRLDWSRFERMGTPIKGKYWNYVVGEHQRLPKLPEAKKKKDGLDYWITLQTKGIIEDQEFDLTRINLFCPEGKIPASEKEVSEWTSGISHALPKHHETILNHLSNLFEEWRKPDFPQEQVLERIAEIHWWVAHAMFFVRGSAASAEMLVESMMKFKGIEHQRIKPGYQIDLEAMLEPDVKDYKKKFASFFTGI